MLDKPIVIVDIETTGASSKWSRITEIGALKIDNGSIVDEFTTLVNPGSRIPAFITELTGIRNEDVADAPHFEEVAPMIDSLFEGSYFMAHNVMFDFSFIKRQMEEAGFNFRPRLLCSVKLSRALNPGIKGHSLEKIIARHNIAVTDRHRALADAEAVHEFINIMTDQHGHEQVGAAMRKQLRYKALPPHFDDSLLDGIENNPGVYVFKDKDGTPVYIGKSVQLRSRILSHFAQSTEVSREMKLSASTHTLETINTDSELEALLLESELIKKHLPVHNIRLRRKHVQTILTRETTESGYDTVHMEQGDIKDIPSPDSIFGVYDTRTKAKNALLKHRDTFDLCNKLLGLEKSKGACFNYQLGRCKGACIGKEAPAAYNLRFDLAFQKTKVERWKYGGPVVFKASPNRGVIVDEWRVVGTVDLESQETTERDPELSDFDMDTYKILSAFARKWPGRVRVQ